MPFPNPSDDVLRHANALTLIDPNVPGWLLIVVPLEDQRSYNPLRFIYIPVDSTDAATVQGWRDHLATIPAT